MQTTDAAMRLLGVSETPQCTRCLCSFQLTLSTDYDGAAAGILNDLNHCLDSLQVVHGCAAGILDGT